MFDDSDSSRKKEDRNFRDNAEKARDEPWHEELSHSLGDLVSDILVPDRMIPEETRRREAAYHKTKEGKYDPGNRPDEEHTSEGSRTTGHDWSAYGDSTASGSSPTVSVSKFPGWAWALLIFLGTSALGVMLTLHQLEPRRTICTEAPGSVTQYSFPNGTDCLIFRLSTTPSRWIYTPRNTRFTFDFLAGQPDAEAFEAFIHYRNDQREGRSPYRYAPGVQLTIPTHDPCDPFQLTGSGSLYIMMQRVSVDQSDTLSGCS